VAALSKMLSDVRARLREAGSLLGQGDASGFLTSLSCLDSVIESTREALGSYIRMVEEEMPEELKERFNSMRERVKKIVDTHARAYSRVIPDLLLSIADALFDRALIALSEKHPEEAAGYIKAAIDVISRVEDMYTSRWWLQLMRAMKQLV